jgi:hypothetical protein
MNITTPHKQQQTQEIIPKKKRSNVNEKSIQRRQDWKSGKPKPGECKKKRKVEKSTLPAFAKSKVGSSCGTTGLEATTV